MEVSLSDYDHWIYLRNSYNNSKNRKVNEKILEQNKLSNKYLIQMHKELATANATSQRILENQIKDIERAEEQKYYKALSFHTFELINEVTKTDDKIVLCYIMDNYYLQLKTDLITCNDVLNEIGDKVFNKKSIEKLEELKSNSFSEFSKYQNSLLAKINKLLTEYNLRKKKMENIKNDNQKFKVKSKINFLRIIGILILTFPALLLGLSMLIVLFVDDLAFSYFELMLTLVFSVPLFFLIQSELNWRKNYNNYKINQENKQKEEEQKKVSEQKEMLELDDVFHENIRKIQQKYPTFDIITNSINNLSSVFYNKLENNKT